MAAAHAHPKMAACSGHFPFFFEISHFKAYSEHFRYIGGPSREARWTNKARHDA